MAKSSITFKIDRELLGKIKALAAKRDMSVRALAVSLLEESLQDLEYEQAKERQLARMRKGFNLGARPIPRDELHDR